MRLSAHDHAQLTYCTNIHPADGWAAVQAMLKQYAPALKARLAPDQPFGVGLRLSARDASELLLGQRLRELSLFLADAGLYVAIVNGFPYGTFHGAPVKASVYAPDWRDPARVAYTLGLVEIVRALVPAGIDGGVSTVPLSYKPWAAHFDQEAWDRIIGNLVQVAESLVRIRRHDGTLIHLDIEPEPDCSIENTAETVAFFADRLLPHGAPRLAAALEVGVDEAQELLREHIRICFDCCHFAVAFEEAPAALERLRAAGIKIGRAQLSSALAVTAPANAAAAVDVRERLRAFADSTYLHQVVERRPDGLRHYLDLPDALERPTEDVQGDWRIHFHVPLFAAAYERLGSTQHEVATALRHMLRTGATRHFEIETYTWDVLPAGLKLDLLESIVREYEWVLGIAASAEPGAIDRHGD